MLLIKGLNVGFTQRRKQDAEFAEMDFRQHPLRPLREK
jgi:hypothetical protein